MPIQKADITYFCDNTLNSHSQRQARQLRELNTPKLSFEQ
jgi:hypothetical protein